MNGLFAAVRELEQIKLQAKALGVFTDDRELLECPSCGLLEDVTAEGLLVTYVKDSADLKDCGLRFRPVDETTFECPSWSSNMSEDYIHSILSQDLAVAEKSPPGREQR